MQFSIEPETIQGQCYSLSDVADTVLNIENMLRGIRDGLSSLSLDKVKPAIDAVITKLAKNKTCVVDLSDALNRITKLYYQAESTVMGFGVTAIDLTTYDGTPVPTVDYTNLMEQYGLSDISLRYLQDYYPELLVELQNSSNSDEVLNKINSILENNHVTMMEDYGYSYAAIKYLIDNCPGMISSLYATSHWSTSDVDNVRLAIYNLCHENDICVYDPVHDFDSYNYDPDGLIGPYGVQYHTNCYSYAFGLTHDPRTGELLPVRGLQPGYLSDNRDYYANNKEYIFSRENNGEEFVNIIKQDAEVLDLNFEPYEEGMTGGTRVALVLEPYDVDGVPDYHWYFYDEASGTWYNKQGLCPATDCYLGDTSYYNPNIGVADNQGVIYTADGQTYVVDYGEPIGSDYTEHAQAGEYYIDCGEFYITTQDGSAFQ